MQITNMLKDEPKTDTEESVCCVDGLVRACVRAWFQCVGSYGPNLLFFF